MEYWYDLGYSLGLQYLINREYNEDYWIAFYSIAGGSDIERSFLTGWAFAHGVTL